MKSLNLIVAVLNFVIYFSYNGSQEIYNQSNQHFAANSPLSSSDNHTASQISFILRSNGNATATEDANSYSGSTDTVTRLSGFLSERNHSKTLQGSIYNIFPFGNYVPRNSSASQTSASFAYGEGTVDNSTQTGSPISNASRSSAAVKGMSVVSTTTSSFAPNSRTVQGRVVLSRENSISAPVSMTMYRYMSDPTVPQFQINSKAIQSPEPFFPSTGSSKPFFASNPAAYIQNPKNDFTATKKEDTITTTNTESLLGTDSTTQEKEAGPDSIFFINTMALMAGSNTGKIDATDILEGYVTLPDVPELEDDSMVIIDATYLGRYSKRVSNAPDFPRKDNSIVIDATDMRNNGRVKVNAQTPGISFSKKSRDFASVPTLSTYDKAETKPITIATDIDRAMPNINPMITANYFLNDRMPEKSNEVVSNYTNTKTMIDVAKYAMQVGNLNIPQTNRIISTKQYANPNLVSPSRDDGTLVRVDASTFIKSVVPSDHPQARNPMKKTSLANIIMPKTFHNKAAPAALTLAVSPASQGDVDTMFYIPRYESENSFMEDIILNYKEASPQKVGIMAEAKDTLQGKSVGRYNYITSPASENVPRDRYLTTKYYPINSDVYDSTRLRGTIKTMADQTGFRNPAPSYMVEVSKPLLTKLTPKFQGKMTLRNSNSGTDYGAFFGGDNLYLDIKENIPKGYTIVSERESMFTIPDFRIPIRDNINPALKGTMLLGKETFSKNQASNIDKQIDLRTKKDQPASGSITKFPADIIPVTSFTSISSEDKNREDYSHISRTGTPLSPGHINTLGGDSFILGPGFSLATENKLDDMNFIIAGPDKSDSEYLVKPQAPSNLKVIFSDDSTLTLPEAPRPNDQNIASLDKVTSTGGSFTNTATGSYGLPWKSTLPRSDFTAPVSTPEVSGPPVEHSANIDQNWEMAKVQSVLQPISMVSSLPLEDPTTFSKSSINVASERANTENGGISDKTETTAFSPKLTLQPRIDKKEEINKSPDHDVSLYINEAVIPSTEEITPSETQASTFHNKDKAVKAKLYISEANIPVNLREVNTVKVNPFILKPDVTSAEWKAPGTLKEAFYPDSIMNTAKLTTARTKGSFFLDNENIERFITNSYKNLPLKSNLPHTDVTKVSNFELDPTFIVGEDNIEMTEYSNIDNAPTIISLPNDRRMEYPLVPEPELMTTREDRRMFTADSIDPAVIITPTENKNQFHKKVISSAIYNNAASDGAKATISARLDANKDKRNLADVAPSQNSIIYFNVIPDDDHAFISKDTEEANNRTSISSSSISKATTIVTDPISLSKGGNYEGGHSVLSGENNVKSRGFPSLSTSAMLIPIAITENSETSDLMRYDFLSESSLAGSEVLEIINDYADAINGGDIPEGQITITQTDIQSHPLAGNAPSTGFTTFTENPTAGEVDSVFFLNRDAPDQYKAKAEKTYFNPQRATMKAFSLREDSQNNIYGKRKIANLPDQKNPTPKFLSHFTDMTALIPTVEKIHPSATEPNTLSKSDNNMKESIHFSEAGNSFSRDASTLKRDPFLVKSDASLVKPQAPSNLKVIFSDDSTLTLPEAPRPNDQSIASLHKVTNTGGSFTNTATGSYGLPWKSTLPPSDFTTPVSTPKYSELAPFTTMEIDTTTRINNNARPEKSMIPFDQLSILPSSIASEKAMVSTFNKNIFGPQNFRERERDNKYERIFFIEDNSERGGDISSADKFISAYVDSITITFDDSGSDGVSDEDGFESEKKASNSIMKMSTFTYAPKTDGSFASYSTAAASKNLSKAKLSEFETKGNHQTVIPRQEHKNFDIVATAPKDSTAHVNSKTRSSTTYFLIDPSENFPPIFTDKTSVGKNAIDGNDVTIIPYEGSDFGNKINKHFFVPGTGPIVKSRTLTTDATNHAVKNRNHFFRKNTSPVIYNTFIPAKADTTTSTTSGFAKDETGIAVVSDSRFSTFPSAQLSDDGISSMAKSTQGAFNTALTSFSPLKKMSVITWSAPAISTKDKNHFGHSSLPLSSLRLTSMGQPGTLFLIADGPSKETVSHRLGEGASLSNPPMLILGASEPVSTYSTYFNEGIVPEGQNAKSQMVPSALPLVYTFLQTDSSGSSDQVTDVKLNPSATISWADSIYGIDVSGGVNSGPKKTTKFSTLLPVEYNAPNSYHTREITKASVVKDRATESEVNRLSDVNIMPGDGSAPKIEINSLRDADIKPFLVNKNVIADARSISKDYGNVPIKTYSSSPILKDSLSAGSVWQEANSMAGYSNLPMKAINIIPTDEKSSPHTEIISLLKGNSQLEFGTANLGAANNEFQALESTNITPKSIAEREKILPKLQEISVVPQNNKEAGKDNLFKAGISPSPVEAITPQYIPGEPTDKKPDLRVMNDSALNATSIGNKEIVAQQTTTPFN